MGLQTRDLCMVGLGVRGDVPGTPLQEVLPDGIHLRWAFTPGRGFPWFGYHLFRRPADQKVEPICIAERLEKLKPGPSGVDTIPVGVGTLTSDVPFVLTDDFVPTGRVEADLRNRSYVRFDTAAAGPVRRARVTIGFRSTSGDGGGGGTGEMACVSFADEKPDQVKPPIERLGAKFSAFDSKGRPVKLERFVRRDGRVGWDPSFRGRSGVPCPADRVEIEMVHSSTAPTLTALDANGKVVASQAMKGKGPETIVLAAPGIVAVDIDAPSDECLVLRACWRCGGAGGGDGGTGDEPAAVPVTASWQGTVMAATTVSGPAGSRQEVVLDADAIDRVEVGGGADAALVELCVTPVRQGLAEGWDKVDGFTYPLPLPVAQGDYPCPGAPGSPNDAETTALDRVVYGSSGNWAGKPFDALHQQLERLVQDGPPPAGTPMSERSADVAGSPAGAGPAVAQARQRPLDLVLMGSLQPAIAQMLGLYWWDGAVQPGEAYDYLLLADHDDSLGGDAASALSWLGTVADFTNVDGYICFGLTAGPANPLTVPTGAKAYALPADGTTNSAGLTWDRRQVIDSSGGSGLEAGAPVLYHVWRAELGDVVTPADPADGDFKPLTEESPLPVGRARAAVPVAPEFPSDWPQFGLQYIDRAGADGWYAYRVSSVDLFGRHSRLGPSAAWWQWGPDPAPRPWYYTDPAGDRLVHASKVRLLDKIPPPAPAGVEAVALDPADPSVTKDAAWTAWRDSLTPAERTSVVGVRVSWHWTADQQIQAPDTREFRIYHHPAPLDTVRGRVTAVTPAAAPGTAATESDVVTDITTATAQPAGSFTGLSARIGADSFTVLASQATAPGQPLRLRVRNIGPARDGRPPVRSTTRCSISLPPGHNLHRDHTQASPWNDRLLTVGYAQHVQVEPNGDRRYEVFLPVVGSAVRTGLSLVTTVDEPVAFGAIGITAVDARQHTADHRGDPARYGNESSVGGPATVLRVRRELPPLPTVPADSATVYATPADYHNRSFHTYRWQPAARMRTLVFRALDDAVFQADWAARPRAAISAGSTPLFPSEATEPRWDQAKRQQVATELNALNTLPAGDPAHPQSPQHRAAKATASAAYAALSNDALRVLAGLPGNESVFVQLTPQPIEPDEPELGAPDGLRWRRVGPDAAPGSLPAGQRAYVDALDGRATNRYFYRCTHVDEVHNVGPLGLSGAAVTLPDVTPPVAPRITKVTAGDKAVTVVWASNRAPDLAEYRVYRTFEREASDDIRLMDLVHTSAVDTAVAPADRPGAVEWTDSPVPGLRDLWYRVVAVDQVRADPRGGGGNVSAPSPAMRARAYDQTPPDPPQLTTVEWVVVGADGTVLPWGSQPVLNPFSTEVWEPAVRLAWSAPDDPGTRLLVQSMGTSDDGFATASAWLTAGTTGFVHRTARTFEERQYRLKAVSGAGNANQVFHPATLPSPSTP
jgi:hypothetical protein